MPGVDGGLPLREIGRLLVVLGVILAAVGALLWFADRVPGLGRLPGDLVFRKGRVTIYFPIVTSIVLSILLTLILYLITRR